MDLQQYKKQKNNMVIDTSIIPSNMSISKWSKVVEEQNKIIFNGNLGHPILNEKECCKYTLVDITTPEGSKIYEEITNDVMF